MYMRNFSHHGPKWLAGNISEWTGPISFKVTLESNYSVHRRHIDDIRPVMMQTSKQAVTVTLPYLWTQGVVGGGGEDTTEEASGGLAEQQEETDFQDAIYTESKSKITSFRREVYRVALFSKGLETTR